MAIKKSSRKYKKNFKYFSSNLYRDYLKTVALPKLDSLHNVSSNATDSLEKIYDKWNSDHQEHGNCTYGSGMNQVQKNTTTTTMNMTTTVNITMTMLLQLTMTYITFTGWLSYAGCYAASLSSAIASLIGAPRILQVLKRHSFSISPDIVVVVVVCLFRTVLQGCYLTIEWNRSHKRS